MMTNSAGSRYKELFARLPNLEAQVIVFATIDEALIKPTRAAEIVLADQKTGASQSQRSLVSNLVVRERLDVFKLTAAVQPNTCMVQLTIVHSVLHVSNQSSVKSWMPQHVGHGFKPTWRQQQVVVQ